MNNICPNCRYTLRWLGGHLLPIIIEHCKPCIKKYVENGLWVVYYEDKVFLSDDLAIEWDMENNPDHYTTDGECITRYENDIWKVKYEELDKEQKEYLHYLVMI